MRQCTPVRLKNVKFPLCFGSAVCVGVLWALGLLDHLSEVPFEHFEWPPFTDVRKQVRLELNKEPLTATPVNDWKKFKPYQLPQCYLNVAPRRNFLLIAVKSTTSNIAYRRAIRDTWGAIKSYSDFTIRTIFIVARLRPHDEKRLGDVLYAENREYGDLLVGDFYDDYYNNTLKFLTAIQFAYNYCAGLGTVPFVFLVDDDYIVSIPNLIKEVKKWEPNDRLYMGWRFDTSPVRFRFSKYRVSLSAYPFGRYPPYITAGAVLLSHQSVIEVYLAIQHLSLYRFDDIYMGIIAHFLALPAIHNKNMHFYFYPISDEGTQELICSHGHYGDFLRETYGRLRRKNLI